MKQKLIAALRTINRALGFLIINLLIFLVVMLAFGALFMLLWNSVMPDVFNLPEINIFQSVLLLLLINVALISLVLNKHTDDD